jgi:FkbM family methyltransferase
MVSTPHPKAFILLACDDAPMIFSRLDWQREGDGNRVGGVGAQLLEGTYEPDTAQILRALVLARRDQKGDGVRVLDCGAHVGAVLVPLAKFMTGWGEIIGIEAQERLFYALAGNIALNNLWNAHAICGAVADRLGFLEAPVVDYTVPTNLGGISLIPSNNVDHFNQKLDRCIPVTALTIDCMRLPRLDVIKIDVEGMELQVLKGAENTIQRDKPFMVIEWIKVEGGVDAIKDELPGYRCEPIGMDVLAIPADNPLWDNIVVKADA